MSFLTMRGQAVQVYESPKGKNRETGEEYGGTHHVQLLCEDTLKNGEVKMALFTLRTDQPALFRPSIGKVLNVPCSAYVRGNEVAFYLPPGKRPESAQGGA
jgi:hypothetical protein